ncbi:MAG: hypothetical protein P4L22_03310 [Candidatus Babeliales bacterium]|nr:hypothetical protein [Candidatus Babeliales bacterium]
MRFKIVILILICTLNLNSAEPVLNDSLKALLDLAGKLIKVNKEDKAISILKDSLKRNTDKNAQKIIADFLKKISIPKSEDPKKVISMAWSKCDTKLFFIESNLINTSGDNVNNYECPNYNVAQAKSILYMYNVNDKSITKISLIQRDNHFLHRISISPDDKFLILLEVRWDANTWDYTFVVRTLSMNSYKPVGFYELKNEFENFEIVELVWKKNNILSVRIDDFVFELNIYKNEPINRYLMNHNFINLACCGNRFIYDLGYNNFGVYNSDMNDRIIYKLDNNKKINSIAIPKSENLLVTCSDDKTITVWEVSNTSGKQLEIIKLPKYPIQVLFSNNSKYLSVICGQSIKILKFKE